MADAGWTAVTAAQMRRVDELAVEKYHLKLIQMMENAGRNLAHLALRVFLGDLGREPRIAVLAGPGGNGGGGMVAARRLHNWGARVSAHTVFASGQTAEVPAHQMEALQAAGVEILPAEQGLPRHPDLIIDALLGYSLHGSPRSPMDVLIETANGLDSPILALDLPSGLAPDSGRPHHPTIQADATMTLALPKVGLLAEGAADYVGQLWLADISIPFSLYQELSLPVSPNLFAAGEILKIAPS